MSSLVLDQNQSLKDAYDKIRKLNEELETANKELEQIAAYDAFPGSSTAGASSRAWQSRWSAPFGSRRRWQG